MISFVKVRKLLYILLCLICLSLPNLFFAAILYTGVEIGGAAAGSMAGF